MLSSYFCFPASHTTIHTVRHTAVIDGQSYFLRQKCVRLMMFTTCPAY